MHRLITLGRIELSDAGGRPISSILSRPKRLALLTYLALGGGSMRSRDSVIGVFWPEESQARARQSLNQALYVLRQALGRDVVVSVGNDQIGLAPGAIWCDAVALRAAAASGDHRSAQAHYRGEFLPGFYLSDAPDFEKWLDGERTTLRRLASASAWKLAEEAAAAGDVETAASAAARSAELSLREEAAVRRAIELLDSLGERARALDLYRELENDLAEDFGTRPAPETQEVVARVRAREAPEEVARAAAGADRIELPPRPAPRVAHPAALARATPAAEAPVPDAASADGAPAGSAAPAGRRSRRRMVLLALPVAVGALAIALLWTLTRPATPVGANTTWEPHLLIEPFAAYAGDERLGDVAGAITSGLAAQLANVEGLDVLLVERGGNPSADSAAVALGALPTGTSAWFVLRGHVLRDGSRMQARVSLIDRATGQVIASANIQRVTSDPLGFIEDASDDAATFARAAVGRELRERAWRASTSDVDAWRLLERAESDRLEGNELMDRDALSAADAAFVQADSLLARAEAREPDWVAPVVTRAVVAHDRMWVSLLSIDQAGALARLAEALGHSARAVDMDPRDARARELNGMLLHWQVLLGSLAPDSGLLMLREAESELRAAVDADQRRAAAWSTLSAILSRTGRFEESYYAAQRAHAADAFLESPEDILVKLFDGAFESGDDAAARRWCSELAERFTGSASAVHCALTVLGWLDAPQGSAAEGRRVLESSEVDSMLVPYFETMVARLLALEGERDGALALVRRARAAQPWNSELLPAEAAVHLALDQRDSASVLLRSFIDQEPLTRQGLLQSRRFLELRE